MDGTRCTVTDLGMGEKRIECDDGTIVTVTDGVPGMDGMDGSTGTGPGAYRTSAGLVVETMEVGIADATRIPYAVLRFTDEEETPLDREGRRTEGAISVSFTIAYLPVESRLDGDVILPYVNYITRMVTSEDGTMALQPATDSEGTWTEVDLEDGVYRYDFGTVLPADYDTARTHTIGYYATRTFAGVRYVVNDAPSFRPDGMAVTETRDIVTNDACNNCHTPLALHGGAREDVRLCATCHAPGYEDPESGNTLDFQTMVHKIHRGSSLPSVENGVDYFIVGFRGSVHDYSDVEFPQDVRNCTTCHAGPDGDNWNTVPSRASCGSCHDDIWFEAGDPPEAWQSLHPGGDRPDDDRCTTCHIPTGVGVSPIVEQHYYKHNNPANPDVQMSIDAVRLNASRRIEIDFTATVDGAPRDVITAPLNRLRFRLAGPTTDYLFETLYDAASVGTLTAIDATMGQFTFLVPDDVDTIATAQSVPATGSWAVSIESGLNSAADGRMPSNNPVAAIALTGASATARRSVVSTAACNTCHLPLGAHGDNRTEPDLCAFCHNPTLVEEIASPAMGTAIAGSLGLGPMVHRIHASSSLLYPGDLRECGQCHLDGTSGLPLADTNAAYAIEVIDTAGAATSRTIGPAAATCGGCHSSSGASAHFETNTTSSGAEACAACHGAGASISVESAHARPEYQFR
jgi:OmcA/MtrC family decaheme c-type cytochrome